MTKKRAVAYCRVSTKSEAQIHSFGYQNEYWENTINADPQYEFVGIYADEGISGRSMSKRPQMIKMLKDARAGMFDVIFTKSVARFARNTAELLKTVRELRDLGIKVFFEKEQIDTFNPGSELYLTIAASVAENDLKIYSENQRWAIRNKYKNGWISIGTQILGYRMDKETNTLIVEPSEVETVRRIFELYMQGKGILMIAKIMTAEQRSNVMGNTVWDRGAVRYILTNEKYKGCVRSQKFVNKDGVCILNRGYAPQYYMENTHEAIIPPEVFDKVQAEVARRGDNKLRGKVPPTYTFTQKIVCGVCGKGYAHKIQNCGKPWQTEVWVCDYQNFYGQSVCDNTRIKDSVLKEKFVECYNEFIANRYENVDVEAMRQEQCELLEQERELTALKVNHLIDIGDYDREVKVIRERLGVIGNEMAKQVMSGLTDADLEPITEYSDEKVEQFIEKVTINKKVVTFTFINGVSISKPYDNGRGGNKKGWYERHLDRLQKEEES
jgi:DNA invertase Pin-like site-specific DNA recombinase